MAPDRYDPRDARRQAAALRAILRRSGWYDRQSILDAQYRWAATGLPLEVIEAYLAAGIADPRVAAEFFLELGISAQQLQLTGIGEQVSIGRMSVDAAAKALLGPRAAGGLDQVRAAFRDAAGAADPAMTLREGARWWQARLQRLSGFLDDRPIPSEYAAWLGQQSDELLLGNRDAAVSWAGPLTIAVAQQELERLDGVVAPGGPKVSDPLVALVFGALASQELTRRLGARVEAAILAPPAYVTAMLGPYPDAVLAAQLTWTQGVLAIEGLRLECGIDDPEHALGAPDFHVPPAERLQFQAVNRALTRAAVDLQQGLSADTAQESRAAGQLAALDTPGTLDPEMGADWGAEHLVDPDAMRPDEELTWRLGELIPPATLPAAYVEAAATLSDEELATRWGRAVERHLRGELWEDPPNTDGGPVLWAAAIRNEAARRVDARVEAIAADPPAYITDALGRLPREEDRQGDWLCWVEQTEEYRLLTGTTDPTRALGLTPPPDSSWQQCWRRELVQHLADAHLRQMTYQHRVVGSPEERNDLMTLAASTVDPWFGLRPAAALVDESQELSVGELRRRVTAALPLLAERPENHASQLRDAQLRTPSCSATSRRSRWRLTLPGPSARGCGWRWGGTPRPRGGMPKPRSTTTSRR